MSVVRQDENIEVIVVDDRSQDNSADVARAFMDRNAMPGRVITAERNGGPSNARNLGWKSARGEWIQFLDADDLLNPGKIHCQYAHAESASDAVAVLYSPWDRIAFENGEWGPRGEVVRSNLGEDAVLSILADREFGYVGPTLIRRRALEIVDGFSAHMVLGEDLDLMLRIAMSGSKFEFVPSSEALFHYRDTSESLWHRVDADINAAERLVRSVRRAEMHVRASRNERIAPPERLAIAARYAQRLDVLERGNPNEFKEVLSWISDLHVRSAPHGSPLTAQIVAGSVGLTTALKIKFGLRRALGPLRRARPQSPEFG